MAWFAQKWCPTRIEDDGRPEGIADTDPAGQFDEKEPKRTTRSEILAKPVVCWETGKVYASSHSAAKETGILTVRISEVLRGKKVTAGGFHWHLLGQPVNLMGKNTPVICLDTGAWYDSVIEAAEAYGVSGACVSHGIARERKLQCGVTFRRATIDEIIERANERRKQYAQVR